MVTGLNLPGELVRRVDDGIDLASQGPVRCSQRVHNFPERYVADNQQVDIAVSLKFVPGSRTKDEGGANPLRNRGQALANHTDRTGGFHQQRLELFENRRCAIDLKIDLPTVRGALQDAGVRQRVQLTLGGSLGGTGLPQDLPDVKRFVRMPEQPGQQPTARPAEEDVRRLRSGCRNHFGYVCTQFGYDCQAPWPSPLTTSSSLPRSSMTLTAIWLCSPASNGALVVPAR